METERRSPLRILAPVALALFTVTLLAVVVTADAPEDRAPDRRAEQAEQRDLRERERPRRRPRREGRLPQDVYIVKTGDTLGTISEKTGVPVERLQELNPQLDPQALVSGQRIKLRE